MCPICWMTPRALPAESKSCLSQLSHKKLIGVNEEFKILQGTIEITRWEITSARIPRQDEDRLLLFSRLVQQRMDSIWQKRERGRKQSKPGVGSRYRSFQTRQILGLKLSQDRRESLVLFWIPGKI